MDPEEIEARVEKAKTLVTRNWYPKPPITLSVRQKASTAYFPPTADDTWTSQVRLRTPAEEGLRQAFLAAIRSLDEKRTEFDVAPPEHIRGEWVGHRPRTQIPAPSAIKDEASRYGHLHSATTSPVVVLYAHGGGFIVGGPSQSRRGFAVPIARLTGGKCFSLDYRLSPQNMFPAALYDMLLAYLALLCPPKDAAHTAISASSILLAGDSAGANLCFAFVQLLFQLRKQSPSVPFDGNVVSLPLPAGVSSMSGYVDLTDCMPSMENAAHDYFPRTKIENEPDHPHDEIWPSKPARESAYCADEQLCHPLCSPMAASDWRGAPPMWICAGEEAVADSCKAIAQCAASQGVPVSWSTYERLPHVWHLLPGLGQLPQTTHCLNSWAQFCKACVSSPSTIVANAASISRALDVRELEVHGLLTMTPADVRRRMTRRADHLRQHYAVKNTALHKL